MSTSSLSSRLACTLLPLLTAGGLVGCASTTAMSAPPSSASEAGEDEDESNEAEEARDEARALLFAEFDLAVAELEAKQSQLDAERGLVDAERSLAEAQRDLRVFLEQEQPAEVAEKQLSLDRYSHRRELAEDELNELISMYAAEEFAELTKELVLKRGRKSLEFAQRGLVLVEAEFALLQSEELPQRQRKLEQELVEAQQGVEDAQRALKVSGIETKVALMKAQNELDDLREDDSELDEYVIQQGYWSED